MTETEDSPKSHDYLAPALAPIEGHFALVTTTFTNIIGPPIRLEVRVLLENQLYWIAEWELSGRERSLRVGYQFSTTTNGKIRVVTWYDEEDGDHLKKSNVVPVAEVPEALKRLMPELLKSRVEEITTDGR